jgi:hypothetical protein
MDECLKKSRGRNLNGRLSGKFVEADAHRQYDALSRRVQ